MALFKMTRATGHALNLPPHAIRTIQSIRKGTNAEFPRARSHIRYDLGAGPMQAMLVDAFEDLRDRLAEVIPSSVNWVEVSVWRSGDRDLPYEKHDRLRFDRSAVVAVEGLDPDEDRNGGGQTLLYLNLFGQGQSIATASFDDANDITALLEAEVEALPDQIVEEFRQPPRSARVAAPKTAGAAPKAATKTRAVPVPAKGPPRPTGVKKAAKPASRA